MYFHRETVKTWFSARLTIPAPNNDFEFFKSLIHYGLVNQTISENTSSHISGMFSSFLNSILSLFTLLYKRERYLKDKENYSNFFLYSFEPAILVTRTFFSLIILKVICVINLVNTEHFQIWNEESSSFDSIFFRELRTYQLPFIRWFSKILFCSLAFWLISKKWRFSRKFCFLYSWVFLTS